ncbi:MAG: HDIG domain-containing metalloprotein [Pseudomonadota bacterium]
MDFPRTNGWPTVRDCLELMSRFGMPPHVVRHSQAVCGVALYLGRGLLIHGVRMDLDLIRAGALLHDITKVHSFKRPLDHALTGAKLLRKLGYPRQVEAIVRQHVRLGRSRPRGRITEIEIVNYSDKRIVNDQVTSLAERLAYIRDRYARTPEAAARIEEYAKVTFRLEEEIFEVLPGSASQVLAVDPFKELEK